jgi:hypothetical protein
VEKIFLQVNNSNYYSFLPEYISVLLSKFKIEQLINFSKILNESIKEKIINPDKKEIDSKTLDLLSMSLIK